MKSAVKRSQQKASALLLVPLTRKKKHKKWLSR
jgi:hypothetical protein